jgi:O-antigen ligase
MSWLILLIVAWGALAFGSVYDWAYGPLLAGCLVAAVWGFVRKVPRERRRVNVPTLTGLLLVALAAGVQLVSLDRNTLRAWSPATDEFLAQYDVRYAIAAVNMTREAAKASLDADRGAEAPRLRKEEAAGPRKEEAAGPRKEEAAGSRTEEAAGPRKEESPAARRGTPGTITHPLSISPAKTQLGLMFLGAFSVMLLGLAHGIGGRDLRVMAPGIVGLGVLMSMIGIIQKALWNGKVYGFWEPVNVGTVAFGPFINRNHFAGWMLLALPIAVAYFASQVAKGMVGVKPGWRTRIIWFSTPDASRAVLTGFGILVMGLALVMTLSRSGISCFLLAMLLSGFNVLRRQTTTSKQRWLSTYLALVFVAAVAWAGMDAVAARFADVDWKLGGRAGAWEDAWRIHEVFPWFGTGLNTYGSATLLLQQFEKATAHYVEAHNDYLQLLVEGGWLIAVPALVLMGLFAWQVRSRFREGRDDRTGYWIRLGAVTGIIAIAFQEIGEFSLQMPGNAAFFTILCAIALRRASIKSGGAPDLRIVAPAHRRRRKGAWLSHWRRILPS